MWNFPNIPARFLGRRPRGSRHRQPLEAKRVRLSLARPPCLLKSSTRQAQHIPSSSRSSYSPLFRIGREAACPRRRSGLQPGSTNADAKRSEEHTSELQSLRHLVCRLLLEKKKKM